MDAYIVIGNPDTCKSSVVRSLTGYVGIYCAAKRNNINLPSSVCFTGIL
jgi:hypothetical protein